MNVQFDCRYEYDSGFQLHARFETESAITVLLGPSGSGKSTILSLIAGMLHPKEGRIAIGERVLVDRASGVMLAPEKRRVGYVFQDPLLFPHMTVEQNLRFSQRFRNEGGSRIEVDAVVQVLGIGNLMSRMPRTLSGGEQQRVALGRSLASSPELLLMDEPVSSLDHELKMSVLSYLISAVSQWDVPVIYVTHSREEQQVLGGEVKTIKDGQLLDS